MQLVDGGYPAGLEVIGVKNLRYSAWASWLLINLLQIGVPKAEGC